MAFDAHGKFVDRTTNRFHSLEVTVLTVTLDEHIITTVDTVSRRIENHGIGACQTLSMKRAEAFLAT
jgi:hypothetical protein